MKADLNPIEVSLRDARKAQEIVRDMPVSCIREYSNVFIFFDDEEWNAVMEAFEEQGIELL